MTDIQTKYQKLATEYAKLRAQIPILKKAVLDEQAEEDKLKEELKKKDQVVRKYEQEIDSLTFRNQQLSARVTILQDDLEQPASEQKGKKNKVLHVFKKSPQKGATTPQSPLAPFPGTEVIGEELQNKIEENARLHKKVHEADREYQQTVTSLQERLNTLEVEASQHQEVLTAAVQNNKGTVEKLQEEKAMLEVKLQSQERESKDYKWKAQDCERRLNVLQEELGQKLSETSRIIAQKLPFNDAKYQTFNSLNIPIYDRRHQLCAKELVGQAIALIKELVQSLSNFHTYCEQRSRIYPIDSENEPLNLSDTNKKLCQYLHENALYLRPIEQSFKVFYEEVKEDAMTTLETAVGLQNFASCFNKYVNYAKKLLPYELLSIEEESSVSSCTKTLEHKNMELHGSLEKFTSSLASMNTYIQILAGQSKNTCDHPRECHSKLFELFAKSVTSFHEATKEVSLHYNAKVALEHQLPTATQKLKTTDECVVSSLVSLVTTTGKVLSHPLP